MIARTVYETLKFQRGLDPKDAMDIGNKYYRLLNMMQPRCLYHSKEVEWDLATFFKHKDKIYYFYNKPSNRIEKPHEIQEDAGFILPVVKIYKKMTDKGWNTLISSFTFNEAQKFIRGLDPKDAMDIGKKAMDQKIIDETDWSINKSTIKFIYDIIEVISDYKGVPILILKEKNKNAISWPFRAISVRGLIGEFCYSTKEALKMAKDQIDLTLSISGSHFLKETHNFERGLDPKQAMGIGLQKQFIKWMNELRLGKGIGSINLRQFYEQIVKLEIAYYGDNEDFDDCIKQFPKDVFSKITIKQSNLKSWQRQVHLLINPKYEKYFKNCFDKEGFIKES